MHTKKKSPANSSDSVDVTTAVGIESSQLLITLSLEPRPWINPPVIFIALMRFCSMTISVQMPDHILLERQMVRKPFIN